MSRITEQQAKQILFNAQTIAYPNREVPEMLKPLYTYIETVELENTQLRKELEQQRIDKNHLHEIIAEQGKKIGEYELNPAYKQAKAERDAAVEDLKGMCEVLNSCAFCIHDLRGTNVNWPTIHCNNKDKCKCWQWRGLEARA